MYLARNLLILAALVTGCAGFTRHFADSGPAFSTATGELARGAGSIAANPANPIGWAEAIAGLASVGALAWGGKKAYTKVRDKMGKKAA